MESIYRSYTLSVFDQIMNLQNCFTTPKQKPTRGEGLRQINTCRQVPLQVNSKKSRHSGLDVLLKMSNSSNKPVIEVYCIYLLLNMYNNKFFLLTVVKFSITGWRSLPGRFVGN